MSDLGSGSESGSASGASSSTEQRRKFVKWPPVKLARKLKGVVWKYFTEKQCKPDEENPLSLYWICVFCDCVYTNKHATRLGKHILKCGKASESARIGNASSKYSLYRKKMQVCDYRT